MSTHDLCFLPAVELARLVRARELSAVEVVDAHLELVDRVDRDVNAIVTRTDDAARAAARAADARLARGEAVGPLHGLPVAHKDFSQTKGIRTTLGSPIYADHVPDVDQLCIERLTAAGAITIGKTNTPEFAAGSQTFNPVFGATRNPYALDRTAGGSSGGAAAALACGMVPIADGTDMGGSLRNPASFCNVVGLRPSPGRVPSWPAPVAWHPYSVHGPMARTVADVALMLSVMAGPDDRSPIALETPGTAFAPSALERDLRGVRIAWSRTLDGLPVEPEVTAVLEAGRDVLAGLGAEIADAEPDLAGADEAFEAWRAWIFELILGGHLDDCPELLGESVRWNVEEGRRVTGPRLGAAERARTELYHRMRDFFTRHDFLVAPVVQVLPFDVDQPYPRSIAGEPQETYIQWMRSCSRISVTGLPAASVPCGFTEDGLPVGLQIVGRHRDDLGVLQLAHAFERATEHWRRRPPIVPQRLAAAAS